MLEMEDEDLIKLVRKCTFLYDKNNVHFKNSAVKKKAWESIGPMLNVTGDVAEQRWGVLRNRYATEKRKLKKAPPGSDAPWNLYGMMSFLAEFVKPRKSYGRGRPSSEQQAVSLESLVPQLSNEASQGPKSEDWDSDSNPFGIIHDEVAAPVPLPEDPLVPSSVLTSSLSSPSSSSQFTITSVAAMSLPSSSTGRTRSSEDVSQMAGSLQKRLKTQEEDQIMETKFLDMNATTPKDICKATETENAEVLFGHSVGLTLTQFSKKKRARAKIEILQVLEKYEEEEYE